MTNSPTLTVSLGDTYPIYIGTKLIDAIECYPIESKQVAIVTSQPIADLFLKKLKDIFAPISGKGNFWLTVY